MPITCNAECGWRTEKWSRPVTRAGLRRGATVLMTIMTHTQSEGQWTQNNIYKNISLSQDQILVKMLMRVRHEDCEWI